MSTTFSLSNAIDQLIAEDALAALPEWDGAPLGFTSRYYSSTELDAAAERRAQIDATKPWTARTRHGWVSDYCGARASFGTHTITSYTSDARCLWDYHQLEPGQRPRLVSERIRKRALPAERAVVCDLGHSLCRT